MTGSSDHASARELRSKLSMALAVMDEPQDWGIANADGARLDEFVDYLNTRELAPTQVFDMVELVLASANERLIDHPSTDLQVVRDVLRGHPAAAAAHYDYWASLNDPEEFPLAAWLRHEERPE